MITLLLPLKQQYVPLLFTEKQWNVMKKYSKNKSLTSAEKKALYTSIKKKTDALATLPAEQQGKEYYITGGEHILPERVADAKRIIDEYKIKNSRVFIGGSFLYSRQWNDIDIFIVRERGYKEEWKEKQHIIYLSEKKLSQPVFQSTARISIATFNVQRRIIKREPKLNDIMSTYHEAIIEHIQKEKKPEAIRRLIFENELYAHENILNPKELQEKARHATIPTLNNALKELCKKIYSKTYLYIRLHEYITTLKETIKNIHPNKHLQLYKKTYEDIIYERRRSTQNAT